MLHLEKRRTHFMVARYIPIVDYAENIECKERVRSIGVNGLNITGCSINEGKISIEINSPFHWLRKPVLTFHNIKQGNYLLKINGIDTGTFNSLNMEKGITFFLKQ